MDYLSVRTPDGIYVITICHRQVEMYARSGREEITVLVVEDDIETSALFAEWLEPSYIVKVAYDCVSAYEQFGESIDVALLERQLPDGSGDEILSEIRRLGLGWRVAMVTGEEPTPEIVEMEFDDYLYKPVTKSELGNTVKRLAAQARYGPVLTDFLAVSVKRSILETHFSAATLANNEEYTALTERHAELREQLSGMVDTFSETQFLVNYANLGPSSANG